MFSCAFSILAMALGGVITFQRDGLPFVFMRDEAGIAWRVELADGSAPAVAKGDIVEVDGAKELSVKHRFVANRCIRKGNDISLVPPPRNETLNDIFEELLPYGESLWYGETLSVEGMLRDINRRSQTTQLLVGEGERNIQVEIPQPIEDALPANLVLGATVRVTGALVYTSIENFEEGKFGRIENVEILPESANAVEIIEKAPFWTVQRLRFVSLWVLALLAVATTWAATLRRMVMRKTQELADSVRQRETAKIEADAARRERLRIAADLHDGFQQYLAGAVFRLKAARNRLPPNATDSLDNLDKARIALQHTQSGLRSILWAMNEESEGPESILELFRFVSRRMAHWEGVVEISSSGEERKFPRRFALSLLLILQEAVGNAIRHGKASRVLVSINFSPGELVLQVKDNGVGFDTAILSSPGHFGIAGMRRRAEDMHGTMRLESTPGLGTLLEICLKELQELGNPPSQ